MNGLDICNMALARIGGGPVSSIDAADSQEALACRTFYGPARLSLLRAHPWNFATVRKDLEAAGPDELEMLFSPSEGFYSESEPLGHEWSFVYRKPDDFIKAVRLFPEIGGARGAFEIRRDYLLCDIEGASLKYVRDTEDTADFDSLFTEALTYRLAADICVFISGKEGYLRTMSQLAVLKLSEAKTSDARNGAQRAGQTFLQAGGWHG